MLFYMKINEHVMQVPLAHGALRNDLGILLFQGASEVNFYYLRAALEAYSIDNGVSKGIKQEYPLFYSVANTRESK